MSTADARSKSAIGFLTVVEDSQQGLCGGYLVLNHAGRPLEFHCTVPIKANRAQEILYGPTLAPFLYGEQIGQTLLSKAKCQPLLVCTDREPILAVQDFVTAPVVLVLPQEGELAVREPFQLSPQPTKKTTVYRLDTPHRMGPPLFGFQLGRNRVAITGGSEDACATIVGNLGNLADCFDLAEPFQRIREAIEEAQKGGPLMNGNQQGSSERVAPGRSWYPPALPDCRSIDLSLVSVLVSMDWSPAVTQPKPALAPPAAWTSRPPRAVSIPIRNGRVESRSFWFGDPPDAPATPAAKPGALPCPALAIKPTAPLSCTRIRPPCDIIKLEDRLHYILQPALELLIAERSLEFPLQPFPFQMEGAAFLYPRHAAVLADEMGLGKTMQAITAIRLLLRCGEISRVLLVCPKPLVTNWQRELAQWAPEIPLLAIEGDQAKRTWQWQLSEVPVRVANYELVCRDRELFEELDEEGRPRLHFDLVVLDESQRIKNHSSTTSQVVRSISRGRNWALTGTPVENSSDDLVSLFEFLVPGFLSVDMKPRKMGRTVRDYVLRRTKDQVLTQLPPKLVADTALELTPEQRESYQMAEQDGVLRLEQMQQSVTIQHVFELVLRLKQICNFDPATGESSKLERLEADLEEVAASGRKAIVFSQWVTTIRRMLGPLARFNPLEYHGRIASKQRDGVIERFRDDPSRHVLLMSYGAGSVGLNLQFASYVFLFDRWWNPAVEDQAINRAHRIGVAGPVTVSRFLMLDTIEERIDRVLQEKRELFDTIFSETDGPRRMGLTQSEIFGLFHLRGPSGPIELAGDG